MHPDVWGPHFWYILHIISFNYPEYPSEYDKRSYYDFFRSLADILPCDDCRKHYKQHFHAYPIQPHLDSRSELIKWVIQMHNFVNERNGKPVLTVAEVINIYENLKPVSPFYRVDLEPILEKRKYKKSYRVCGLIIVGVIIILFMKWYHNKYHFF
jgi:hypothetical protein